MIFLKLARHRVIQDFGFSRIDIDGVAGGCGFDLQIVDDRSHAGQQTHDIFRAVFFRLMFGLAVERDDAVFHVELIARETQRVISHQRQFHGFKNGLVIAGRRRRTWRR